MSIRALSSILILALLSIGASGVFAATAAQSPVAAYKSAEYAEESAAKEQAKTFRETLEKNNYEVVRVKVEKEATLSDDVFQYSFIIAYRARPGHAFQPIRRYYRDGFASSAEAKKAYDEWLAANAKKGAVLLVAQMNPLAPQAHAAHALTIDYAYNLKESN